jgi:hypothetical protein
LAGNVAQQTNSITQLRQSFRINGSYLNVVIIIAAGAQEERVLKRVGMIPVLQGN